MTGLGGCAVPRAGHSVRAQIALAAAGTGGWRPGGGWRTSLEEKP